ncbi:MAG: RelA/SpoT family protein [Patescibacteria group bacterium]
MKLPLITIEDVLKNFRAKLSYQREALIRSAYAFALEAHQGQKRKSGEDYIQHPLYTALYLAKIGMRSKTITAALLHDIPEDTGKTLKEIEEKFGPEIAFMVDGVTKLGNLKLRDMKEEAHLENLRKMFLAMASDIRVVIIRLADRLHNMETLDILTPEKKKRIALETMEIYVPIANRLGIGEFKGRLEDLAFEHLDPENFRYVETLEKEEYEKNKQYLNKAVSELKRELSKEGIRVEGINGRVKRLFRLFQKLKRHDMDISKIYDLIGIRIIVPEVADCYEALGIVHKKYHPLVGRIKDYISLPKPNGYQSIHTTIFGPMGKILEVQIRTPRMDLEAEFGIAAPWIYSEKKQSLLKKLLWKKETPKIEKDLNWVKQLREWQIGLGKDDQEFAETLKIDFFKNQIFAFTPLGDIVTLPEEATPIDFAYRVHSQVGSRAIGAKANGKMVPFDYHIKNGDVVEIITSRDPKNPSRDWLRFVKTSNARSHIRKFFNK